MKSIWKYLPTLFLFTNSYAIDCVITVFKNSCWKNYETTITIRDAETKLDLSSVKIPLDKMWGRTTFTCHSGQRLEAKASFSPDIWEGDGSKVYLSKQIWSLPDIAPTHNEKWSLNICYSNDFSSIPEPINSKNCVCDTQSAPPVK